MELSAACISDETILDWLTVQQDQSRCTLESLELLITSRLESESVHAAAEFVTSRSALAAALHPTLCVFTIWYYNVRHPPGAISLQRKLAKRGGFKDCTIEIQFID